MASVSFGGLGNGIDFGQVIDQLVKAAHLPVDRLTSKKTNLNSKNTDYATLGTKIISLQSAASALRLPTTFDRTAASTSDATVLSVTASSSATVGSYSVRVEQLAQSHQIANKAATSVAAATTDIVSGASGTFTFRVGSGADQTVTLNANGTLENLRDAINDLGAGVTASYINTGIEAAPAYRLVLTATGTGTAQAITVVADTTTLDFLNNGGSGGVDTLQAAQNAKVVVGDPALNPLTIERSSNTITDAISNVTLTLNKTTGTDTVQVNVTRDTTAVKNNIKALAAAYNDVIKFINERNTYDITTKQGGIFFNEPTVRTVLDQLRGALASKVSGLTSVSSVGEVGFKTERDGTITVDDAQLEAALSSNYSGVKNLFISQSSSNGVAQLVTTAVEKLNDIQSGALTLRKNGLTSEIAKLTTDITRKEDALSQYEERLRRQYAALDGLLRQIQGQASFLQSQSTTQK